MNCPTQLHLVGHFYKIYLVQQLQKGNLQRHKPLETYLSVLNVSQPSEAEGSLLGIIPPVPLSVATFIQWY
jgi:hypothetical protein